MRPAIIPRLLGPTPRFLLFYPFISACTRRRRLCFPIPRRKHPVLQSCLRYTTTTTTIRPKTCPGCGIKLQFTDKDAAGYIPPLKPSPPPPPSTSSTSNDILSPSDLKHLLKPPKPITCQRCHTLKNHNIHSRPSFPSNPQKLFSGVRIKTNATIVLVADLTDFPASFIDIRDVVGPSKRIILVLNKWDLVGCADISLSNIQKTTGIPSVFLTSAKSGKGVRDLARELAQVQASGEDIYFMGSTNAGKSALLNSLHQLSGSTEPSILTTSAMPGTTADLIPVPFSFSPSTTTPKGKIYDSPGLFNSSQLTHHLSPQDLKLTTPTRPLTKPRLVTLVPTQSVFIGGLVRFDYSSSSSSDDDTSELKLSFYISPRLPTHTCKTDSAESLYAKHAGKSAFMIPPMDPSTLPPLREARVVVDITPGQKEDLVLGGIGWVHWTTTHGRGRIVVYSVGGEGVSLRHPFF